MNKLIVILGPTASGKTDLSIKLALWLNSGRVKKKFNLNGVEIVSADSRQIYKGMDIGSGKITKKEMRGIPHHLLNVANPKNRFTVVQYQKLALKEIKKIHSKNKIPILVGGTGFYIQSIVDGIAIPEVKPDWNLRKKLEKKSNTELYEMLVAKDPARAKVIDKNNPRRLIRALEIILKTNLPIPRCPASGKFDVLQIGAIKSKEELKKLIEKRLKKRLKNNSMINEVRRLHNPPTGGGVSWKRLEEFGLEYKFVALYLQDKISRQEMVDKIQIESEHYAKRQMTWFKRDKKIHWVHPHTKKDFMKIEKLCKTFLSK